LGLPPGGGPGTWARAAPAAANTVATRKAGPIRPLQVRVIAGSDSS
jgi:hypothetical protein